MYFVWFFWHLTISAATVNSRKPKAIMAFYDNSSVAHLLNLNQTDNAAHREIINEYFSTRNEHTESSSDDETTSGELN